MWNFKRQMYKSLNLASIGCNAITQSGGMGVTEYVIELDKPLGGIVVMDFNAQGVPDKIEILHNGIKKATSGMTVANEGPFDNIYGSPTVPDSSQANATDQFIGTGKGTVPTRDAVFLSETGITDVVRTNQQLVWWVYTAADYNTANTVVVRVTGIQGTAWNLKRLCTNQDPSGIDPNPQYSGNCYEMTYTPDQSDADLMVRYTNPTDGVVNRSVFGSLLVRDNNDGSFTAMLCSTTNPVFNKNGIDQVWTNNFSQTGGTCEEDGQCMMSGYYTHTMNTYGTSTSECTLGTQENVYTVENDITVGVRIYLDPSLTAFLEGGDQWWGMLVNSQHISVRVNVSGYVMEKNNC